MLNTCCQTLHEFHYGKHPGADRVRKNGISSIVNATDVILLIIITVHNLGHIILWLLSRKQTFIPSVPPPLME